MGCGAVGFFVDAFQAPAAAGSAELMRIARLRARGSHKLRSVMHRVQSSLSPRLDLACATMDAAATAYRIKYTLISSLLLELLRCRLPVKRCSVQGACVCVACVPTTHSL